MTAHGDNRSVSNLPKQYRDLAKALGGKLCPNESGCYCLVKSRADELDRLGRVELGPLLATTSFPVAAFMLDDVPGQVDIRELLFVDTETTGLGGTGTVPFLVGCGQVKSDSFEIRQYLLPDYSDETALLEDFLAELSKDRTVVTYNGTGFDIPLLRDRFVINRVARQIPFAEHLDLLYPTRRLFKRRLKDCSLINIEREIFGHVRAEDIPGYLIPSVYFEWLNQQTTDNLRLVLEHNRQDILTLYYLSCHIASAFLSTGKSLGEIDDLHSLSRVFGRRRETVKAVSIYERMTEEASGELAADIRLYHSFILKRSQNWARASAIWNELADLPGREGYWACVELAKYYEHLESDLSRARKYTERAIKLCPYGEDHRSRLDRRLERLVGKLSR